MLSREGQLRPGEVAEPDQHQEPFVEPVVPHCHNRGVKETQVDVDQFADLPEQGRRPDLLAERCDDLVPVLTDVGAHQRWRSGVFNVLRLDGRFRACAYVRWCVYTFRIVRRFGSRYRCCLGQGSSVDPAVAVGAALELRGDEYFSALDLDAALAAYAAQQGDPVVIEVAGHDGVSESYGIGARAAVGRGLQPPIGVVGTHLDVQVKVAFHVDIAVEHHSHLYDVVGPEDEAAGLVRISVPST